MSTAKPKAFMKQAKGKKKKEQPLDDADDYLAAAVEDEDAMGKHRGGDAIKSLRFARKALDLYTLGLQKYPKNFDLAYNKARLELEIATHPTLVRALDIPVSQVLQQALTSHRYTLSLDSENADTLFNIAQVLTTIAEYIAKDDTVPETEALRCLEEALEYQSQCLRIQDAKYTESRNLHEAAMKQSLEDDEDGGATVDPNVKSAFEDHDEEQEQWVSIVEPVTVNTLVDTILSQLSTLTTLCTILTSTVLSSVTLAAPVTPSWIESYSVKLMTGALSSLASHDAETMAQRSNEMHRTKAIFSSAFLEFAFYTGHIKPEDYISNLNTAFSNPESNSSSQTDPETLIAHARALITLNSALSQILQNTIPSQQSSTTTPLLTHRWTILTRTINLLTTASQQPTVKSDNHTLATTHLLRADTSLLMYMLSQPPASHPPAVSNKNQLLKNAEVFYRNAAKLFGTLSTSATSAFNIGSFLNNNNSNASNLDEDDEKAISIFRGAVVEILKRFDAGQTTTTTDITVMLRAASVGKMDPWRTEQINDMLDEGLVPRGIFEG